MTKLRFGARLVLSAVVRMLACCIPRSSRRVVIGGWSADLYADNSKYFLEYALEHSGYEFTWIVKPGLEKYLPHHKRLGFAVKGSLLAWVSLLRSKTWICCQNPSVDLTTWPIDGFATVINLWHGIPIKSVADRTEVCGFYEKSFFQRIVLYLMEHPRSWVVVASKKMGEVLVGGIPTKFSSKKILPFGTPRNDFLLWNKMNGDLREKLKRKYGKLLGFDFHKRVVIYMPTWRMRGDVVFSFYNLSVDEQERFLELLKKHEAVLIEKHHHATYNKYPFVGQSRCSIVIPPELQREVDVQELLLIADILVSDYSGAIVDFGLLERPCIHFAYDYEEYASQDSGFAYDLRDVASGEIVRTEEDLLLELGRCLDDARFKPRPGYSGLVEYEKGKSCERLLEFIRNEGRYERLTMKGELSHEK